MTKPFHIVFTTIFVPHVLETLVANVGQFGKLDSTKVWLVADRKTPAEAAAMSDQATRKGLETVCLSVEEQDRWGEQCVPEFYCRIPYNNETRRNLGYLRALEDGCETLISIDDDNLPVADHDFVGRHAETGKPWGQLMIHEKMGFHNICEYLRVEPPRPIFPRGYPFNLRGSTNETETVAPTPGTRVGVTAGLWLKEPDIDATTWLNGRVASTSYEGPNVAVLAQDTWTPVNTQNTSVTRDLIPAYLCVPMGHEVPGGRIERYGDIWGGYFLQAVLAGTSFHVAFGLPLVEHRRNPHNYVDDLRHEFWGMILTDWLVQLLRTQFKPAGDSINARVKQLAEFLLSEGIANLPGWAPAPLQEFIRITAQNLSLWADACQRLG